QWPCIARGRKSRPCLHCTHRSHQPQGRRTPLAKMRPRRDALAPTLDPRAVRARAPLSGTRSTVRAERGGGRGARRFHGWWIVLVAFVCHAVNTGLIFYAWSVFLTPLAAEFGGRGHVAIGYALMQLASAAYGIAVGRVVDRRGARPVEIAGAVSLATGFLLLSRVRSLPA